MKGIILLNKTDTTFDEQGGKLASALISLGVDVQIVRNNATLVWIKDNKVTLNTKADFCVFWDKDVETAYMLEKTGLKLFNCASATEICDDKMRTHIELGNKRIKMPDTISIPLIYRGELANKAEYEEIINELGRPFVLKENHSSLGLGVFLIRSYNDFHEALDNIKDRCIAQQYIKESHGKDLRIIVVGGKAAAWMKRENYQNDFRSGIATGGIGESYLATKEQIKIAEKVAKALKLDFCGVDLLFGNEGVYLSEINSNALCNTIEQVSGVPIIEIYAKYILSEMKKLQFKKSEK